VVVVVVVVGGVYESGKEEGVEVVVTKFLSNFVGE
jgi:hypothetical protein